MSACASGSLLPPGPQLHCWLGQRSPDTTSCLVGLQALQDRFIPTRSAMDLDVAHYSLTSTENDAPANSNAELLSPQKVRGLPCRTPSQEAASYLAPSLAV